MKKIIKISIIIFIIVMLILILIPCIKIDNGHKIIYLNYDGDISKYDENLCYHESVSYVKDKDISITNINIDKRLMFYVITLEYEEGNLCDSEYLLEEAYIENFIENANITYNPFDLNIKKLIEGREAIVGNIRYLGNNYDVYINYKLDDRYDVMYVFYKDDLLILQVGDPDETIKFIAYR